MPTGQIKTLSKDILYYGLGNLLYSLMQLICMPIIIKDMSIGEVANWNILLPTGVLLSALVTFGMDSSLVRFVIAKEEEQMKIIFSTAFYFLIAFAFFTSFSLWAYTAPTTKLINISSDYLTSYWTLLVWLPGVISSQYFQKWFQYTFQRFRFVLVIALQSVIYLIIILYLKVSNQIDLQNVLLASLISVWIPGLLGLCFSFNMLVLKFNKNILIKLLIYGGPFMILAFGFNLVFSFDKFILTRTVSPEDFAVYSQAFRVTAIFAMIISSFNFAFGPFSLSLLNKEDASHIFGKLRTYYLFFMCLTGLSFIALGKLFIFFLSGQDYIEGYKYMPFFIIGYILYGLYSFSQLGIIYSQKSYLGLYALMGGLLSVIGLDVLLIPSIKGFGAGIGFAFGIFVMVLFANMLSRKYLRVDSKIFKEFILFATFIVCSVAITNLFPITNLYIDCMTKLFMVMVVFGVILFSPPFKEELIFFQHGLSSSILKPNLP